MTKGLPDPPASLTTAPTSFSTCESSHPPLFSVRPGVDLEDALVHLSTLLRGASEGHGVGQWDLFRPVAGQ